MEQHNETNFNEPEQNPNVRSNASNEPEQAPNEPQGPSGSAPSGPAGGPGSPRVNLTSEQEASFKKARRLSSAAMLCAVVSLFIGGMLLSAAGLICAFLSYRALKRHFNDLGDAGTLAVALKRTAVVSAMFCATSFALNAFAAWQMMPMVMDMLESGTVDLGGASPNASNSTWG